MDGNHHIQADLFNKIWQIVQTLSVSQSSKKNLIPQRLRKPKDMLNTRANNLRRRQTLQMFKQIIYLY